MEKAIIMAQLSPLGGFHSSPITSNDSNLLRCAFRLHQKNGRQMWVNLTLRSRDDFNASQHV